MFYGLPLMNNLLAEIDNMLQTLIEADRYLFLLINKAHDPIVDFVMFWATDKWIWIPFYIWLIYILIKNFGKKIFVLLIIISVMITLSDQASVMVKEAVHRLRPCRDPYFAGIIHLVKQGCGGQFGFISSHASNTMSLAVLIAGIIPAPNKWLRVELFSYVLLVGYSRIYLAAHFPGDILGGWLLGILLGFLGILVFNKFVLKEHNPL